MKLIIFTLLLAIAFAEDYTLDRTKGLKASDWALPALVGVGVGLAMVMFGFLVWTKAEGFTVCAMSRQAAELEKIQGDKMEQNKIANYAAEQTAV